jgi:hypothetical protein
MHSTRRLPLATSAIVASMSREMETRRAEIATRRQSAEPTVCPPDRLDSGLAAAPAYRAAAWVWEAKAQSVSTVRPSIASAVSSCQKLNSSHTSRVSACFEAEPIFETRSSSKALYRTHGSGMKQKAQSASPRAIQVIWPTTSGSESADQHG